MGVFTRRDSPFYWIYLERPGGKGIRERTRVPKSVDNRALAERIYTQRMAKLAEDAEFHPRSREPRRGEWCAIYFISDGTRVKIGRATNVQQRLRSIQTGHPHALRVLATFGAHPSVERLVHQRFRHLQLTRGKEWFEGDPELMAFIARVASGIDPTADLVNHQIGNISGMTTGERSRQVTKPDDRMVDVAEAKP